MNARLDFYTLVGCVGGLVLFAFGLTAGPTLAAPQTHEWSATRSAFALLQQTATPRLPGFPQYPPTADADSSMRHEVELSIPARLRVERTGSRLSVSYDFTSLRKVKIAFGKKMTIGIRDELRVYEKGAARPLNYRSLSEGSISDKDSVNPRFEADALKAADSLNSVPDGIPEPGKRYIIEHDLSLFETDIPPQHMWSPESGKGYRVLWERRLKALR